MKGKNLITLVNYSLFDLLNLDTNKPIVFFISSFHVTISNNILFYIEIII